MALGDKTQRRDCKPHYSYCSSSDPRLTFGLGALEEAKMIRVRWADGSTEEYGPFEVDRDVVLVRGKGR